MNYRERRNDPLCRGIIAVRGSFYEQPSMKEMLRFIAILILQWFQSTQHATGYS